MLGFRPLALDEGRGCVAHGSSKLTSPRAPSPLFRSFSLSTIIGGAKERTEQRLPSPSPVAARQRNSGEDSGQPRRRSLFRAASDPSPCHLALSLWRRPASTGMTAATRSGDFGNGNGFPLRRCLVVIMVGGGIGIALLSRPDEAAVLVSSGALRRTAFAEAPLP
nr:hypothetical protein Iba_chr12dCG8780 [Ipomoea batatas]